MAKITFDRFDLGIDLRKGVSVSDANRLREMQNAYVTTGLATQKRPGLVKVADLEPGTKGLFAAFGKLHTFYGVNDPSATPVVHADPLFEAHFVPLTLDYTEVFPVSDVHFADVFNGFIYAAVEYAAGPVRHHYLDGVVVPGVSDSAINEANCPHSKAVIKVASKIFAVGNSEGIGDVVRYCKTGETRDWSAVDDAGFLPTGLNSRGDRTAAALGTYQGKLVVLSKDGAQVWTVDPDPANMKLDTIVENVGTSFPRTVASVAGDLHFLSDYGFRSITTLQLTNSLADVDVGSPIDSLVRPETKVPGVAPRSFYFYGTGQYICAIENRLFVYSISRTAKIAAWSQYSLSQPVDAFAELGQTLYIRSGDSVYKLDEEVSTDDGQEYEVVIQLPYLDLKAPGDNKQIYGADIVVDGRCEFSVGYDVRDPDAFTTPVRVKGNTRGGGMIPVECCGTEFSLRFRNFDDQPFRLDSVTLYYNNLGQT